MDTTKELNSGENACDKMEDGMENLSKIRNPEVDTPIQLEEQLDILKERENVKDEPHARTEVENDRQGTIITEEDTGRLCHTSLKIKRKVTYRETKSRAINAIDLRKCNKFRVGPDCQKRKTMSLKRKEVLAVTIKPFLRPFQQQDLSHEKNKFQPESQNVQEDKSRIVDGDLKTKNDSIGGFPTKSPFMNEVLFQPVSRKRVLGYDNLSSSFSQSTYADDVEDEDSGNVDARDTETKSDNFGDFLPKLPSIKVNPTSANQFKEVSISEHQLSSSPQSSSVPLTTHDTTSKSQSQKVKSPEEVWADFLSSLKTSRESTDRAITGGATRQNVEALESKDDGFKDSKKREIDSTDKNSGNFVDSKRQNVEALEYKDDGFKDTTKRETDSTGKNFGNFVNAKTENASTKFPSDVKNEISLTQYGTEFAHPYENSLSRLLQSTSKPTKLHATATKSQSQRVKSAEEVWTHFRLHLIANMESFDRIFTDDARRENVETSESVYPSLKGPTTTAKDSASQNSDELLKIKTENARNEIQEVKSERPRILDVIPFIYEARVHFLKIILLYEKNLKRIQENCQEESEMERKIKYLIDAKDLGKKLDVSFKVLYDEQFIFNQIKAKLKSISSENNLSNATSLVDLPMSTRHIKSFSLLFLYLYRSLYCEVPVENIFEKINFKKCLLVYKQFQELKKIQEWARNESENVSIMAVCFNASLEQFRLKFKHATLQLENNSLEDYQRLFDHLRISIYENVKCLKELISLGSSMVVPVMKYSSQSRRQLLKELVFLDQKRSDVFTCHKNAG